MKQEKTFDCVEMKNQAQARLAEEYLEFGPEKQEQRLKDELLHSDDIVAKKWRQMTKRGPRPLPPLNQGSFPITDEFLDRAKREGQK